MHCIPDTARRIWELNQLPGYTAAKTDDYLDSKLLVPEYGADPSLPKSRDRAHEAGIPEISVSPQQGQFLSVLAKGMGATKILEIGTLYG